MPKGSVEQSRLPQTTTDPACQTGERGRLVAYDDLAGFLEMVEGEDDYIVDEVLKSSDHETTQRVSLIEDKGFGTGPFIRKYLNIDSGLGSVYEILYKAQLDGREFRYVPRIYSCYRTKDQLVVVMQYAHGETLSDVVYRCDPSSELAADVFPRVCDAVKELHEGFNPPVIHRDLKPSNIILSWDRLTLIDYGIARVYNPEQEGDKVRFGTREFAPPEQFGYGQTDVRSDVYALGMVLFYCLTERIANAQDRERHFADSMVPEEYRQVIDKAAAFDPNARYATVRELAIDFAVATTRLRQSEQQERAMSQIGQTSQPQNAATRSKRNHKRTKSHTTSNAPKLLQRFIPQWMSRISLPTWLGRVWNAMVLITWIFFMAVCVYISFVPNEHDQSLPLWYRIFEYLIFLGVYFTATFYFIMDRRRIRKRFPRLAIPIWKEFLALCVLYFVLIVALFVVSQFALSGGAFVSA